MALPPLQTNGTLPPGEHHATFADIVAAFPASTVERQELNQALQDALPAFQKLRLLAPNMIVYINGSYITTKPSPIDIDIAILTDVYNEVQIRAFFDQECPIAATYLDLKADKSTNRQLVRAFTFTRNGQPKGVIILDV